MKYEHYFYVTRREKVDSFLHSNNIAYKEYIPKIDIVPVRIEFTLWSDKEDTAHLLHELETRNIRPTRVSARFTEAEREATPWLRLHPKSQSIEIVNEDDAYEYSCTWHNYLGELCAHHEEQKNLIAIAREPSANSRNSFWTEATGFSVLFCSKKVFDAVNSGPFEGIDFWNVLKRKGNVCENVIQMRSKTILGRECIELGHGEKVISCPMCGKTQFYNESDYIMHMNFDMIPPENDFYETERIFSQGIGQPRFIISQRLYRFLRDNKMTGGTKIEPIFTGDTGTVLLSPFLKQNKV